MRRRVFCRDKHKKYTIVQGNEMSSCWESLVWGWKFTFRNNTPGKERRCCGWLAGAFLFSNNFLELNSRIISLLVVLISPSSSLGY